jgi:histidinol-phosphatase
VTDADLALEDAAVRVLEGRCRGDAFLCEESGAAGRADRTWLVDALDGTSAFLAGSDGWSTVLALQESDNLVLGMINHPQLGVRLWATAGGGTWCRRTGTRRVHVSGRTELQGARAFLPEWRLAEDPEASGVLAGISHLVRQSAPDWRIDAAVAAGQLDLAVYWGAGPWDLAAGVVIVEEAGGWFSDLAGGQSVHCGRGLYATQALRHELESALDRDCSS